MVCIYCNDEPGVKENCYCRDVTPFKIYPYQQKLIEAITRDGKRFIETIKGYEYPSGLSFYWIVVEDDPCDDWSEALGLNDNGLYPKAVVYRGLDIDSIAIDEFSEISKRMLNRKAKPDVSDCKPISYDYQKHDRTRQHGKRYRN